MIDLMCRFQLIIHFFPHLIRMSRALIIGNNGFLLLCLCSIAINLAKKTFKYFRRFRWFNVIHFAYLTRINITKNQRWEKCAKKKTVSHSNLQRVIASLLVRSSYIYVRIWLFCYKNINRHSTKISLKTFISSKFKSPKRYQIRVNQSQFEQLPFQYGFHWDLFRHLGYFHYPSAT